MRKLSLVSYGVVSYLISLGSLVFFAGWLTNLWFPKTVDSGVPGPLARSFIIDTVLLAIFCASHSILARTRVKERMRRFIPRNLERITYCLFFGLLLIGLGLAWQPLPSTVWEITAPEGVATMYALFALSWALHFYAIYLMGWNEFWGLRQVGLALRDKPYQPPPAASERSYWASHGLLVVTLILIPWFSPVMSVGHLYFCVFLSVYDVIGAAYSHRDMGDAATSVQQTRVSSALGS